MKSFVIWVEETLPSKGYLFLKANLDIFTNENLRSYQTLSSELFRMAFSHPYSKRRCANQMLFVSMLLIVSPETSMQYSIPSSLRKEVLVSGEESSEEACRKIAEHCIKINQRLRLFKFVC
jgi:hypothetical protein